MTDPSTGKKSYPLWARMDELIPRTGTGYPPPYDKPCQQRMKTVLGNAVGLSQFGVNLTVLPPGSWSSQRHWHLHEDEFILILEGEVTLVTDEGETLLVAGDVAGFPAGQENGHHLVNKGRQSVKVLEVGTRAQNETATYPDIDLMAKGGRGKFCFTRKNGAPLT